MDAIRSKQIYEALNYDQIANAMVFNLEKKRTATIEEESSIPNSQIDAEILKQTNRNVQALLVALQSKHANLSSMVRPGSSVDSEDFKNGANGIGEVESPLQVYNRIVKPYSAAGFANKTIQQILVQSRNLLNPV